MNLFFRDRAGPRWRTRLSGWPYRGWGCPLPFMDSEARSAIGAANRTSPERSPSCAWPTLSATEFEQSYARSDLLEQRRRLMDAWSSYCGQA